MEAILTYYQVPRGFSPAALARRTPRRRWPTSHDSGRRDLTGLVSFTIDPDEARDFDDAISLVDGPARWRGHPYVHIADVSYFCRLVRGGRAEGRREQPAAYICRWPSTPCCRRSASSDARAASRPAAGCKCVTVEMVIRVGLTRSSARSRPNRLEPPTLSEKGPLLSQHDPTAAGADL